MKLIHVQIFAAVMAVAAAGAGVGLMTTLSAKQETDRRLAKAEADLKALRAAANPLKPKGATPPGPVDPGGLKGTAELSRQVQALTRENEALKRENEALKAAIARATEGGSHKPIPGAATGAGPQPVAVAGGPPAGSSAFAPPPPPDAGQGPDWGAGEQTEIDEMAKALTLSPEQRDETRKIIMEGQNEFERRLIEASQTGERDITVIERIGEEISKKTQSRIDQLLYPEQKVKFQDFMRKKTEGQ